jgi:hypothetical protein
VLLLIGVVVVLVGVVVLLLVRTEAYMGENTGEVVVHGRGHPPVLQCKLGVVCKVLADLILLLGQSVDLGCEVHDPPHDRVLITITCRS